MSIDSAAIGEFYLTIFNSEGDLIGLPLGFRLALHDLGNIFIMASRVSPVRLLAIA